MHWKYCLCFNPCIISPKSFSIWLTSDCFKSNLNQTNHQNQIWVISAMVRIRHADFLFIFLPLILHLISLLGKIRITNNICQQIKLLPRLIQYCATVVRHEPEFTLPFWQERHSAMEKRVNFHQIYHSFLMVQEHLSALRKKLSSFYYIKCNIKILRFFLQKPLCNRIF